MKNRSYLESRTVGERGVSALLVERDLIQFVELWQDLDVFGHLQVQMDILVESGIAIAHIVATEGPLILPYVQSS